MASRLGISGQTVKNQLSALYRKTGTHGRLALAVRVMRDKDVKRKT